MQVQENGHVYVRTYKRVWRFERFFYSFDRFKLPRPVTWWQLWYFIVCFVLIIVIDRNTPLLSWSSSILLKYIGVPAAMAYFLSKIKVDGRTPHKWLYVQIKYLLLPKSYSRGRKAENPGKVKINGAIQYREKYNI
ncbi:hypothetical protein NRS6107_21090 (plasmid) [Bacillus subtilis]|uniref:TcpE family conjugal transfer membrane protein n=1 Tax=Bacillus subtilis TaxID=1423 RepID=UPI001B902FE6|nr:TcpE family conjugal transfer membrane protein [Bacillus subtilis]CAF1785157.1 hypothetical protein NRS6107_04075 [Bacillus subtilis]CAI6329519.1 hypothetical protein NRS6107_21090 [Bacillus subtilis]